MKGAMAELSVNIIRALRRSNMIMIGANQYFFRYFRKLQNSIKIDNLLIAPQITRIYNADYADL